MILVDCMWIKGYVSNLVTEVTEMKSPASKHLKSENDKFKPVREMVSFLI